MAWSAAQQSKANSANSQGYSPWQGFGNQQSPWMWGGTPGIMGFGGNVHGNVVGGLMQGYGGFGQQMQNAMNTIGGQSQRNAAVVNRDNRANQVAAMELEKMRQKREQYTEGLQSQEARAEAERESRMEMARMMGGQAPGMLGGGGNQPTRGTLATGPIRTTPPSVQGGDIQNATRAMALNMLQNPPAGGGMPTGMMWGGGGQAPAGGMGGGGPAPPGGQSPMTNQGYGATPPPPIAPDRFDRVPGATYPPTPHQPGMGQPGSQASPSQLTPSALAPYQVQRDARGQPISPGAPGNMALQSSIGVPQGGQMPWDNSAQPFFNNLMEGTGAAGYEGGIPGFDFQGAGGESFGGATMPTAPWAGGQPGSVNTGITAQPGQIWGDEASQEAQQRLGLMAGPEAAGGDGASQAASGGMFGDFSRALSQRTYRDLMRRGQKSQAEHLLGAQTAQSRSRNSMMDLLSRMYRSELGTEGDQQRNMLRMLQALV